jgi:hypothetical protein
MAKAHLNSHKNHFFPGSYRRAGPIALIDPNPQNFNRFF